MTAWIYADLLQSKRETIYLTSRVCLIIIRRNTPNLLDMSCIYKHQQQRYNTENTKIYMLLHYMYVDIEGLVCKYSSKQVLLKFCNIHKKELVSESLFDGFANLNACKLYKFIKKRFQRRCISVNIAETLRKFFSQNTSSNCFC